jgi:arylsulfate sulfotransferase
MFRSTAVILSVSLVLSCSDRTSNSTHVPQSSPQSSFHGNDNPAVPLAGVLDLEFDVATGLVIKVSGGGEEWSLKRPAATKFHEPIVGLKPNTKYTISAQQVNDEAHDPVGSFEWTTPPLPKDFPPLSVPVSNPTLMEPGMTEFNPWVNAGKKIPLVIVDNSGVVRWYYDGYRAFDDHSRLPNGDFLFTPDECVLLEIDVLGNLVRSWYAAKHPVGCKDLPAGSIPVEIESIHHQESLLPNGNFVVLSTEGRWIDDSPSSEDDPGAPRERAYSVGCVIVEFSPTGEITKYIPLMDLLEPTRIGRGTLPVNQDNPPWGVIADYAKQQDVPVNDWDHANSVVYDQSSDSYYVSLRHQDAVVKVDRSKSSLVWILGTPSNWNSPWKEKLLTPVGDLEWPYHQHAVEVTAAGVGVYDNGNFRAAAFEPPVAAQYSRAVIYSVDEQAKTVQQTFSYGAPTGGNSFFSSAMGSANWLPTTGNELIASGYLVSKNKDRTLAQILEVAPDGTRLFELNVGGTAANTWYLMHRARRIADIRE